MNIVWIKVHKSCQGSRYDIESDIILVLIAEVSEEEKKTTNNNRISEESWSRWERSENLNWWAVNGENYFFFFKFHLFMSYVCIFCEYYSMRHHWKWFFVLMFFFLSNPRWQIICWILNGFPTFLERRVEVRSSPCRINYPAWNVTLMGI